jgi:hypothetical protein
MRRSENERRAFKEKHRREAKLQKRKENTIIAARRVTSLKSADRLKPIIRKPTIPKKNENEELRKSLK